MPTPFTLLSGCFGVVMGKFVAMMWPGTTAPLPSGFLFHQLMPHCVCWNPSARLDQVLSVEPFSFWQGWSWSSSAEKGCRKMPEVGWPCQGFETAQLFCSSSRAQIHSSPSPGQGSGKQPVHGKQLVPRAEPSCGGSWTHLCNEAGELRQVWQCVAGSAALMCQSKLDTASAFPFLASEALAYLPPKP